MGVVLSSGMSVRPDRPDHRPYKLFVFDWDGTLMDSIPTILHCTWTTFDELRLPRPDEAAIRRSIGLGIREGVESYHPGLDDESFARILRTYRRHWLDSQHMSRLFDGVDGVLDELHQRGHLLAVATGKSREGLDRELAKTELGPRFQATRTVTESPSKPSPAMLHEILDELRVDAADAVMVGDSTHDLEMARSAGVDAVAVTSGSNSEQDLRARAPVACLGSVAELVDWMG